MKNKEKIIIKNNFFDLILLFISGILWFFRSIFLFFWIKKTKIKNNIFFDLLNFIFKIWPKNFWKKPNLYRLFSFPWDLINYLFKK